MFVIFIKLSHCLESVHEAVLVCVEDRVEDAIGGSAIQGEKPREVLVLQGENTCTSEPTKPPKQSESLTGSPPGTIACLCDIHEHDIISCSWYGIII